MDEDRDEGYRHHVLASVTSAAKLVSRSHVLAPMPRPSTSCSAPTVSSLLACSTSCQPWPDGFCQVRGAPALQQHSGVLCVRDSRAQLVAYRCVELSRQCAPRDAFLMLVEPFNGLAPWRRTLSRQPTEILDVSVLHLESWRDLLSLAQLHAVIFPRHYEYRIVRCNISRIAVWENAGRRTTWTTTKKTPKATMPSNRVSIHTSLFTLLSPRAVNAIRTRTATSTRRVRSLSRTSSKLPCSKVQESRLWGVCAAQALRRPVLTAKQLLLQLPKSWLCEDRHKQQHKFLRSYD